jgi:hypothetical protein
MCCRRRSCSCSAPPAWVHRLLLLNAGCAACLLQPVHGLSAASLPAGEMPRLRHRMRRSLRGSGRRSRSTSCGPMFGSALRDGTRRNPPGGSGSNRAGLAGPARVHLVVCLYVLVLAVPGGTGMRCLCLREDVARLACVRCKVQLGLADPSTRCQLHSRARPTRSRPPHAKLCSILSAAAATALTAALGGEGMRGMDEQLDQGSKGLSDATR